MLIIGAGLAAYTLAKELRKRDAEVPIRLVSADDGSFYSKPMLSNALSKGLAPEQLVSASAAKMAADFRLEITPGQPVLELDLQARRVRTAGDEIAYHCLVLAVGAHPIALPLAGDGTEAVLTVNSLADYRRFHECLGAARRVAIIGPGLIGCEFANDLAVSGREVVVIGPDREPLERLLPSRAGYRFRQALSAAGVRWRLGLTASAVQRVSRGCRLQLSDGSALEADLVLSAVGLQPELTLARQAGIHCARGIVVDSLLQTSVQGVYALGDCMEMNGRVLPFVMPIMHGARALAATLLGHPTPLVYPPMPVVVKTPACPTVVAPPPATDGQWQEEEDEGGVCARYFDGSGRLQGFALVGAAVSERQALTRILAAA